MHEGKRAGRRTIDGGLVVLIAHFTGQLPHAGLLVELHRDAVLVIAEQAREDGGEGRILLLGLGFRGCFSFALCAFELSTFARLAHRSLMLLDACSVGKML